LGEIDADDDHERDRQSDGGEIDAELNPLEDEKAETVSPVPTAAETATATETAAASTAKSFAAAGSGAGESG
jgi:hypothetical protein